MGARAGVLVAVKIRSGARDRIRTCVAVKAAVLQTAGISHSPTRAGAFALPSTMGRGRRPRWAWSPRRDLNPQPSAYKAAALPLRHSGTPRAHRTGGRENQPPFRAAIEKYTEARSARSTQGATSGPSFPGKGARPGVALRPGSTPVRGPAGERRFEHPSPVSDLRGLTQIPGVAQYHK